MNFKNLADYVKKLVILSLKALRILVQQEIKTDDDQMYTKSMQINTESKPENTYSISTSTIESKPSTKVNRTIRTGTSYCFTTTDWNVDGYLPCPVCGGWVSSSNFSRHANGHDMTTQEIFTKHKVKVYEMVKQRIRTSSTS